jgi:protein-S-isoprenylcysteine O-methyltransferase Ste14
MEQTSYYISAAAFILVMICWFVFAGRFFLSKKPDSGKETVRAPQSILGLALQGAGFGFVWAIRRQPLFSPIVDGQYILNCVLSLLAVLTAVFSVWLAVAAINELGKQWSLTARLVEGHKLITSGVYRIVRHPIYTAMLGMLLATGLVFSHWIALIIAVPVFMIGTKIRTNSEEKLLRDAFGEEYEDWKKRVPGLIPFLNI